MPHPHLCLFCPLSPPALCIWLHSVNHTSQIAPWSQSTHKWLKWIKLITDSHCESWQGIKSCHRSAAPHSSAVFYDGEGSDQVPIPFSGLTFINPPLFCRHPHLYYTLCTLSFDMWTCFIHPAGECSVVGVLEVRLQMVCFVFQQGKMKAWEKTQTNKTECISRLTYDY